MDKVALILLFGLGAAALYGGAQYLWGHYYSRARSFQYGEEVSIWVPDEDSDDQSFFRRHHEYGSFQYSDGSPVTDHRLHRILQDYWVRQNRPRSDGDRGLGEQPDRFT
jgi:hypothetical protein